MFIFLLVLALKLNYDLNTIIHSFKRLMQKYVEAMKIWKAVLQQTH